MDMILENEYKQNAFVAALQLLISSKSFNPHGRLRAPIAILFLKSDLLSDPYPCTIIFDRYLSECYKLTDVAPRMQQRWHYP